MKPTRKDSAKRLFVAFLIGGLVFGLVRFGLPIVDARSVGYGHSSAGGGGLSTVVTDTTLTGDGSSGSPLGVNPTAARAPGWGGYLYNFFQQTTGLSSLTFSCTGQEFTDTARAVSDAGGGVAALGFAAGGASPGTFTFTNLADGIIKVIGPSSSTGYGDWYPSGNGTGWTIIGNLRSKRWMFASRSAIGKAPVAGSNVSFGVVAGSTYVGLGYVGAVSTWRYMRGAPPTSIADTGTTIVVDATGASGYATRVVGNFDLVNVAYNTNLEVSTTLTTAEAVTNLPNATANAAIFDEGNAASDTFFVDAIEFCTEKQ